MSYKLSFTLNSSDLDLMYELINAANGRAYHELEQVSDATPVPHDDSPRPKKAKKGTYSRWDLRADQQLAKLVQGGHSCSTIAREMGRTEPSIWSRLRKLRSTKTGRNLLIGK